MRIPFSIMLLLVLIGYGPKAGNAQTIQHLDSTLKKQTVRIDSLEKKLRDYKENQSKNLSLLEEITTTLKNPLSLLTKSGIVLVALFLLFWGLRKLRPDWYMVFIQNWIDRYTADNTLRKEKTILLLYPAGVKTDFIERFFKKYQFQFYKQELGDAYISPQKELPAIFFAFDEDRRMNQGVLHEYLQKHDETLLFYFGQTGGWDFNASKLKNLNTRINLANARAQIFANLMSTLKYHSATARSLPLN